MKYFCAAAALLSLLDVFLASYSMEVSLIKYVVAEIICVIFFARLAVEYHEKSQQ